MRSLEQFYIDKAIECKNNNDMFGYAYWMQCAFDVSSIEEDM